jgi:hypothetical protein
MVTQTSIDINTHFSSSAAIECLAPRAVTKFPLSPTLLSLISFNLDDSLDLDIDSSS